MDLIQWFKEQHFPIETIKKALSNKDKKRRLSNAFTMEVNHTGWIK